MLYAPSLWQVYKYVVVVRLLVEDNSSIRSERNKDSARHTNGYQLHLRIRFRIGHKQVSS
jgi:hypothetical protein